MFGGPNNDTQLITLDQFPQLTMRLGNDIVTNEEAPLRYVPGKAGVSTHNLTRVSIAAE